MPTESAGRAPFRRPDPARSSGERLRAGGVRSYRGSAAAVRGRGAAHTGSVAAKSVSAPSSAADAAGCDSTGTGDAAVIVGRCAGGAGVGTRSAAALARRQAAATNFLCVAISAWSEIEDVANVVALLLSLSARHAAQFSAPTPMNWEELGCDTPRHASVSSSPRALALEKKIEETRAHASSGGSGTARVTAALAQLEALGERRARLAEQVAEQVRASTWLTGRLHGPRARCASSATPSWCSACCSTPTAWCAALVEGAAGGRADECGGRGAPRAARAPRQPRARRRARRRRRRRRGGGGRRRRRGRRRRGGRGRGRRRPRAARRAAAAHAPTTARGDDVAAGGGTQGARLARRLLGRRR